MLSRVRLIPLRAHPRSIRCNQGEWEPRELEIFHEFRILHGRFAFDPAGASRMAYPATDRAGPGQIFEITEAKKAFTAPSRKDPNRDVCKQSQSAHLLFAL